jgi:hypothetical protein
MIKNMLTMLKIVKFAARKILKAIEDDRPPTCRAPLLPLQSRLPEKPAPWWKPATRLCREKMTDIAVDKVVDAVWNLLFLAVFFLNFVLLCILLVLRLREDATMAHDPQ